MCSFRGSYANRGNGMQQASSDVATGVGIEPTGGIAAAQTLSRRRRYDRSGTPPYGDPCGTRTHICSLRGCCPDRLDEEVNWGPRRSPAKRLRWGEGGNPKHSRRNSQAQSDCDS